ncbi:MAG: BamA/TamA family outer membrane protein [Candidatus Binatia bacterium]
MRRSRRLDAVGAIAALLLLARCSGWAQPVAADLIGQPIVAIDFECAAPIDEPGLRALLPLKPGDVLREEDVSEAHWRLQQKRLFTSVAIDVEPRAGGAAVRVRLVRKPIVNRIRFDGNDNVNERELRRVVRLRENMALTDRLRDFSVDRIRERYVAEGFDSARVTADVRTRSPGEVEVIFRIVEGRPLRVAAVLIDGAPPLPEEGLRKAIGIRVGARYVLARRRGAEKALVALLRERRYCEAEVTSEWEEGSDRFGTLRFRINAGPFYRLEFAGNRYLSDRRFLDLIDLPQRPIVTDGTWRELARRAQRAYQEGGYYFAKVDVNLQPGPPKVVSYRIDEGRRYRVAGVDFEGAHGVSPRELRTAMATRPPSWIPWHRGFLLDDVLSDDLKRLWYLYRQRGFESAEIVDQRTQYDHTRGTIVVTVVVDEGPQTVVERIEHAGLEPIADRLPQLGLRVGVPLNAETLARDRQALVTALAAAGYSDATVDARVDTAPLNGRRAATIHFDATPNVRHRVGTIVIRNNFDTHARVIRHELPFHVGDPVDPEALLKGQTNIYKLGIFRSVAVRPLRTDAERDETPSPSRQPADPAEEGAEAEAPAETPTGASRAPRDARDEDIAVSVAEKPPGSLQWGAGYNTRDGFRGFVEISNDNLQGMARRLSLRGELSVHPGDVTPSEFLGNLGFREPRLNETNWALRANAIAQRATRSVDQFSLERFAFIPALERTFLPGLQAGLETQVEQAQVFDLEPDVANFNPDDQGRLRSISVGPFAVYDGRDDPFTPRRGVFDFLRFRVAPGQLGSDRPFYKVFGQHAKYFAIGDHLTFIYALRGGWARTYEKSDIVPIRERFFLGGRTTVRGFGENDIGPAGRPFIDTHGNYQSGGHPLGGNLVMNVNTELRFPLLYGFGGVVFADGGGVYMESGTGQPNSCAGCGSVSIHDFRRSSGLGLRYMTPVGPVSLDYGFKLDRRSGESTGAVHFSVGAVF